MHQKYKFMFLFILIYNAGSNKNYRWIYFYQVYFTMVRQKQLGIRRSSHALF